MPTTVYRTYRDIGSRDSGCDSNVDGSGGSGGGGGGRRCARGLLFVFTRVCRVYLQVENDVNYTSATEQAETGRREPLNHYRSTHDAVNTDPPSLNTL